MIKGAIFDLDGTLLDSMWVWEKVDVDFLGERGFEVPPDYPKAISAMGFRETAEYTIARFHLPETPENVILEWQEMAERTYHNEVKTKPYVKETLAFLQSKNIRLGVATASYAELFCQCLKRNQIEQYFDSYTETKEVERGKKFPDVYIKAAEKMGCRPEECVVFEDIHQAILAAKSGGFYTIGVYDEHSANEWADIQKDADYAISDFHEFLEKARNTNLDVN